MGAILTYIRSTVLPNGDIKEIRTNPGAAPQVYINGVRQPLREPKNPNPWQPWFAWRPVKVDGKWAWFERVYRRPIPKTYVTMDDWTQYEYGTLFDVLASACE
jgi:hypothetical protein